MRLRIPTAMITYWARISSPRSVWSTQRERSSSHSVRCTPVWNSAPIDEIESLRDRLDVLADLLALRVALLRDVLHLLEHRHVAVRLDVAHDARVAVPVPGAADAPRPGRSSGCESIPCLRSCAPATTPAMPAPMIATSTSSATGSRSATGVNGSSRYLATASSCARSRIAARAAHHALLAFGFVLRPHRFRIEVRRLVVGCHHPPPPELHSSSPRTPSASRRLPSDQVDVESSAREPSRAGRAPVDVAVGDGELARDGHRAEPGAVGG